LARFADDRRRLLPRAVPSISIPKTVDLPAGPVTLNEAESKAVLRAFGVPIVKEVFVRAGEDPTAAAKSLKAPFAVKAVSRDVAHKTEAGGVRLHVAREVLTEAARAVSDNARKAVPDARIDGVLISEMAEGPEMLIGVVNDASFGPMVAVGFGGVLTEIMKDVSYRVAPFDIETARDMIAELRGARLLDGYRGKSAADKEALAQVLVAISNLGAALAPRLKELDINPVFVGPEGRGLVAADALVVLK
jgi:succinyl-CoA synthetase beta subunit